MKRILVVDDEPNIVELLRLYLEKEGFSVIAARDGDEALALHARHDPDLVVLDLMLPGIDGFEVCREIRRRGPTPVLMLTARTDDIDAIVGLELGADDYVTKPFNPRALVHASSRSSGARPRPHPVPARSRSARCGSTRVAARRMSTSAASSCGRASSTCWQRWPATRASC